VIIVDDLPKTLIAQRRRVAQLVAVLRP